MDGWERVGCTKINKRREVGKEIGNECVFLIKCTHFDHWHNGVLCSWVGFFKKTVAMIL